MSFNDNSGDITVDAVLTDTGRRRIARGDGSFEVTKFAFGDDEIDYSLYEKNHPSGSSHADLTLLKTPTFEAVSDNRASLKHRLLSLPRNDLLYLPEMKINEQSGPSRRTSGSASGSFVVAVDQDTQNALPEGNGIIHGENISGRGVYARIDQGLDTEEVSPANGLDSSLVETQYIIEVDNRLGELTDRNGNVNPQPAFIDDDNIASYFVTQGTDSAFVEQHPNADTPGSDEVIKGPRGTRLEFKIGASIDLTTSDFLFDRLGGQSKINGTDVKHIDTKIRVVGGSTGTPISVPFRYVKKI